MPTYLDSESATSGNLGMLMNSGSGCRLGMLALSRAT